MLLWQNWKSLQCYPVRCWHCEQQVKSKRTDMHVGIFITLRAKTASRNTWGNDQEKKEAVEKGAWVQLKHPPAPPRQVLCENPWEGASAAGTCSPWIHGIRGVKQEIAKASGLENDTLNFEWYTHPQRVKGRGGKGENMELDWSSSAAAGRGMDKVVGGVLCLFWRWHRISLKNLLTCSLRNKRALRSLGSQSFPWTRGFHF
jgi:hypothetical protein